MRKILHRTLELDKCITVHNKLSVCPTQRYLRYSKISAEAPSKSNVNHLSTVGNVLLTLPFSLERNWLIPKAPSKKSEGKVEKQT